MDSEATSWGLDSMVMPMSPDCASSSVGASDPAEGSTDPTNPVLPRLAPVTSQSTRATAEHSYSDASIAPARNRRQPVRLSSEIWPLGFDCTITPFGSRLGAGECDDDGGGRSGKAIPGIQINADAISERVLQIGVQLHEMMLSSDVVGLDDQNSLRDDLTSVEHLIANFGHMTQQEHERGQETAALQRSQAQYQTRLRRYEMDLERLRKDRDVRAMRDPARNKKTLSVNQPRGRNFRDQWDELNELVDELAEDTYEELRSERMQLHRDARSLKEVQLGLQANADDSRQVILGIQSQIEEDQDWKHYLLNKKLIPIGLYVLSGVVTQILILVKVITDFVSITAHYHGNETRNVIVTVLLVLLVLGIIIDAVGDYYEDQVEHEWETLTGLCIGSAMVMVPIRMTMRLFGKSTAHNDVQARDLDEHWPSLERLVKGNE